MKIQHRTILFAAILSIIMIITDMRTSTLKLVLDKKNQIDAALSLSVDNAVDSMAESYTERDMIYSRENGVNTFFLSLYAALGISSDLYGQERIRQYCPVIAITDNSGMYVFFHDEYITSSGVTALSMRWSECYPYVYEDEFFVISFTMGDTIRIYDKKNLLTTDNSFIEIDYHDFQTMEASQTFRRTHPDYFLLIDESFYLVKKANIIQTINDKLRYYVNEHNKIASQYGISYEFSLPVIDESELLRSIEQPSMIVVFQGYPIKDTNYYYNRVEVSGASIYKENTYYLEDKGWYKVYHTSDCEEVGTNMNIDTSVIYYNVQDCVEQGAYACEKCCPEGISAPNYHLN